MTPGTRQNPSAMERIWAWQTSLAMADDRPLTGVGFGEAVYMAEYDRYKINVDDRPHVAHSVWFSVLGQAGYVGLGLYLVLMACMFSATRKVRKLAAAVWGGRLQWARDYAVMLECTALTFAVGATFLSKVTFEFIYAVFLLSVPLLHLAEQEAATAKAAPPSEALKVKN